MPFSLFRLRLKAPSAPGAMPPCAPPSGVPFVVRRTTTEMLLRKIRSVSSECRRFQGLQPRPARQARAWPLRFSCIPGSRWDPLPPLSKTAETGFPRYSQSNPHIPLRWLDGSHQPKRRPHPHEAESGAGPGDHHPLSRDGQGSRRARPADSCRRNHAFQR